MNATTRTYKFSGTCSKCGTEARSYDSGWTWKHLVGQADKHRPLISGDYREI